MFLYGPNGQVLTRRGRRIHPDRSCLNENGQDFNRRANQISFSITMCRFLYFLLYYSTKHSVWRNPCRIYKLVVKSTISKCFQFGKNSTDSVGDQEKWNWVDIRFGCDPEKILHALSRSQKLQIFIAQSFFWSGTRLRALHTVPGHRAPNAHISSRYYRL